MEGLFRKRRHHQSRKRTKARCFFWSHVDSPRVRERWFHQVKENRLNLFSFVSFRFFIDDKLKLISVDGLIEFKLREPYKIYFKVRPFQSDLLKCLNVLLVSYFIHSSLNILPKMHCDLQSCKFCYLKELIHLLYIILHLHFFHARGLQVSRLCNQRSPQTIMSLSCCCLAGGRWCSWKCPKTSQRFCSHINRTAL